MTKFSCGIPWSLYMYIYIYVCLATCSLTSFWGFRHSALRIRAWIISSGLKTSVHVANGFLAALENG